MTTEAGAIERILEAASPLPPERIPVARSIRRHAAADVRSKTDLPRFDQSAMDGYAIRAADAAKELRVTGEQPAGRDSGLRVGDGEAVRVFTGAPIPDGASAVVMQEDVERTGGRIRIRGDVAEGEFIRPRGGDLCAGQTILRVGEHLTPARLALLLSADVTDVDVHRLPRIAIVTTGNELRPPGSAPGPGESIDSNGPMLAAMLESDAVVAATRHATDDPSALAGTIDSLTEADVLILSGGVSVGDHDPVHDALAQLGAERIFWKIDLKPGKPLLFARLGNRLVFGLPGNPVSSFVAALLFVRPALLRLGGADPKSALPERIPVPLATPVSNPGHRPHYLRGSIHGGRFHPASVQQSHGLTALAASNAIARVEPGAELPADSLLPIIRTTFLD